MRIVSLLPSATEIVASLGAGDELVGVSHECDEPASVRQLPRLTSTPIDDTASSRAVDDQVKSLLNDGLALYELDVDRLVELAPDVIITQDACEVCAVELSAVEDALAELVPDATLISLAPRTLDEVYEQFRTVGAAIGRPERGSKAADSMEAEMKRWGSRVPPETEGRERPSVYCIEWLDPLMVAGHWVPELVRLAGGAYPWLAPGERSSYVEWDDLTEADPDRIVVSPCGWDMITTYEAMTPIEADPQWRSLRAVRNDDVYIVDGNAYMNRSGPRLVETLEILVKHLWPDLDSQEANDRRAQEMLEFETRTSPKSS